MWSAEWLILAALLVCLLGGTAGALAGVVVSIRLRARVTSLEFDVATLEERLLREVKTRASALGVKAKKDDQDLFERITSAPAQPTRPSPWYAAFIHPDLK